jgi:hypothetical protein
MAFVDGHTIRVFDVTTRQLYKQKPLSEVDDISNIIFVPKKKRISFTTDRSLSHWDLDSDQITSSKWATDFWGNLAYHPKGQILALGGAENRVKLFDVERDVEIGSLVAPSEHDWLMVTPEGRMDASRLENIDEVYWVVKDQPLITHPMEVFMQQFYEPRLLPKLLHNYPLLNIDSQNYKTVNRALPLVTITDLSCRRIQTA